MNTVKLKPIDRNKFIQPLVMTDTAKIGRELCGYCAHPLANHIRKVFAADCDTRIMCKDCHTGPQPYPPTCLILRHVIVPKMPL